jgi:hypothetical protein
VAGILPKLGLQDERLWKILSLTNVNNSHAHEAAKSLWALTPILSKSSSSSYIRSTKKITHFFSFFQKVIMVLIMFELYEPFNVLIWIIPTHFLLWKALCEILSSFPRLFNCVLAIKTQSSFLLSLFAPNLNNFLSQLYSCSLCPCNSNLCKSTLAYVLA